MSMVMTEPKPKTAHKWEDPPIHPANTAPKMSEDDLRVLAEDIKQHGLQEPIILWRDNREQANGAEGPFPVYLLDGFNRLQALKLLGVTDPRKAPAGKIVESTVRTLNAIKLMSTIGAGAVKSRWVTDCNPATFHLSMNAHRRHLTAKQKVNMLKQAIQQDPKASDRKIGKLVGVDKNTVAARRAESGPNGEIPQTDHLPIERAKEALHANPSLSKRELMAKADVGSSTAVKARKQLGLSAPVSTRTRKKRGRPKTDANQAAEEFVSWLTDTAKPEELPTLATWFREMNVKKAASLLTDHLKKKD